MERYIAFLRGINVSGQKIIKMEALRSTLSDAGLTNVKTYIQSGNVMFDTEDQNSNELILKIEDLIEKHFGFRTDVILRKHIEIESIINSLYNIRVKSIDVKRYYFTFLKEEYSEPITVPLFSKNQDVEIIYHNKKDFVSISTVFKGTYGFPNSFIEKLTGIPATTRNPNTLEKLLKL